MIRQSLYINEEMKNDISYEAKKQKISENELIKKIITEYLNKDVNLQVAQMGAIESLRSDIKNLRKQIDLNNTMFIHWLRFFFSTVDDCYFPEDEVLFRSILGKGGQRRDLFMQHFKNDSKNLATVNEIILADYSERNK